MILKTLATVCLALLLAVAPASAQVLGAQNVTAESTGACNAGACAAFDVPASAPSVTLQVSGTFSGTLTFEATSDNITWFTVMLVKLGDGASATTTTATGQFSLANSGVLRVRARATTLASGTARVTATRGGALARWLAPYFTTVTAADALILGAATTSGIRLDLESGTLAVREGDDSAYGPLLALSLTAITVSAGMPRVSVSASAALSAAQCRNTIVNNKSQAAENTLTLPAAAEGLNCVVQVATTGAGALHVKAGAGDKIYLDGVALDDGDKVSVAVPAAGNFAAFFTIENGDGTWDWICTTGTGTWIDGGA